MFLNESRSQRVGFFTVGFAFSAVLEIIATHVIVFDEGSDKGSDIMSLGALSYINPIEEVYLTDTIASKKP